MPNESIQCPNCGSGDVHQLTADSYACEHCKTNFRWVNPTKTAVAQEPKVCTCGILAVAVCCRCGQGLCQTHSGVPQLRTMSKEQRDFALKRIDLGFAVPGLGDRERLFSPYKECMEKYRIPEDFKAIVCTKCAGECCRALEAIEEQLHSAAAKETMEETPPLPASTQTKETSRDSASVGRIRGWFRGVGK